MTERKPTDFDGWIDPHDKDQKQWLPWIKERVFFRLNSGDLREGWHTGGSWKAYSLPGKSFNNDEVVAWCYPRCLRRLSDSFCDKIAA